MSANAPNLPSQLAAFRPQGDEVVDSIIQQAGPLPQIGLAYEAAIKTIWVTLRPEPKPVFTLGLLISINKVQRAIHALWGPERYAQSPVRFLAYRAEGPIFTLGGDIEFYLDCIAKGDRPSLEEYARLSTDGVLWSASSLNGAAITMTTVHAQALGGGIDAPRSCNVMIAERTAMFSYPEIKFNHYPISAVAILSRRVGPAKAHKILSSGAEYSAEEFAELGVLDAVVDPGQGEEWVRQYAAETLRFHSARLDLFRSFFHHGAEALKADLSYLAQKWTDCMLRMAPAEISRLQRINTAQDRILMHVFKAKPAAI